MKDAPTELLLELLSNLLSTGDKSATTLPNTSTRVPPLVTNEVVDRSNLNNQAAQAAQYVPAQRITEVIQEKRPSPNVEVPGFGNGFNSSGFEQVQGPPVATPYQQLEDPVAKLLSTEDGGRLLEKVAWELLQRGGDTAINLLQKHDDVAVAADVIDRISGLAKQPDGGGFSQGGFVDTATFQRGTTGVVASILLNPDGEEGKKVIVACTHLTSPSAIENAISLVKSIHN